MINPVVWSIPKSERAERARRRIGCAGLIVLCAFLMLQAYRALAQQRQQSPPSSVATLTSQEQRGKDIYQRGVSPSGREIIALMGEIEVPSSTLTCEGFHGARGEGKTEGGVTAGQLTWTHLTKSYGHTHPGGRKHGPFNELSFTRAVTSGIDPSRNPLIVAMPRYRLTQGEMADLIAYIKRLETDNDPGVNEQAIIVGSILPNQGPLAEAGAAMRDVLTAYFNELNSRGGIYNRKIELRVMDSRAEAGATTAAAREFAAREQVFAFVGGLSAGADKELAALAAEREIPFVGPATLLPVAGVPVNRQVFYLQPGVMEQARALVNFAASKQ